MISTRRLGGWRGHENHCVSRDARGAWGASTTVAYCSCDLYGFLVWLGPTHAENHDPGDEDACR